MKAGSIVFGMLAPAMGAMAQIGVRINVIDGASMHFSDGQVVSSGGSATFYNPPTAEPWTMGNGAKCHLDGTWDGSHWITFTLKGGASYLTPCGFQDKVRVVCEGPPATCQG